MPKKVTSDMIESAANVAITAMQKIIGEPIDLQTEEELRGAIEDILHWAYEPD